mmetsp:Transcript_35237/g.57573  ORF Transcript_35237/g.57573 Transcript_35237/m.57573 type:complete len:109 (-) Transcript_35237:388-714(-)
MVILLVAQFAAVADATAVRMFPETLPQAHGRFPAVCLRPALAVGGQFHILYIDCAPSFPKLPSSSLSCLPQLINVCPFGRFCLSALFVQILNSLALRQHSAAKACSGC